MLEKTSKTKTEGRSGGISGRAIGRGKTNGPIIRNWPDPNDKAV